MGELINDDVKMSADQQSFQDSWITHTGGIRQFDIERYSQLLVTNKYTTTTRLEKAVARNSNVLIELGTDSVDAEEIYAALDTNKTHIGMCVLPCAPPLEAFTRGRVTSTLKPSTPAFLLSF